MNKFSIGYLYLTVLGLYLIDMFLGSEVLTYMAGVLAIPALLISFVGATKLFRLLGTLFVSAGVIFFLWGNVSVLELPQLMTNNLSLLAFLAMLPWMQSVVRAGRFDRRINQLLQARVKDLGRLYTRSLGTTYLLVAFINLSAIPLIQDVLKQNLAHFSKAVRDDFISRTTLRGFALVLAWSPMEIMVAITVDTTGVSFLEYLPWLLLISGIVLILDGIIGQRFRRVAYEPNGAALTKTINPLEMTKRIFQLSVALTAFLFLVVGIGNLTGLSFIITVTLVIFPFAVVWAILIKRIRSFWTIGAKTWWFRLNNMQNFVVLFVALGFFSGSLNETPFLGMIQEPFMLAANQPLVVLLFIQFTFLAMAMIGMHPIATIGILQEVVVPLYETMNPMSIGIVFITSSLSTASVGTYGITVTMTSQATEQNPYLITLKNMPFALLYGGVGTIIGWLLI
ncbi:hypothetical protein [Salsuginibacillus kocurii]|uniref:hypothetical protein n=1 Tax=Salsuginibacillus kocurii TaxID=427078 RepID=UPI000369D8AB|nr:hypothetical protein [Salsuginibacillus kocurii]